MSKDSNYLFLRAKIRRGASYYSRERSLGRFQRYGAPEPGADVIAWLTGELARERRLHRARHYSYDLNRHVGLLQSLTAEREMARQTISTRMEAAE